MKFEEEFITLKIDTRRKICRENAVWLKRQNLNSDTLNVLNISVDLADMLNINEQNKVYRFDLQCSRDEKTFALYFNPVGLCDLKNRQCRNINLCRMIQSKLLKNYPEAYKNIDMFDAQADVEHNRIIFVPIVLEEK